MKSSRIVLALAVAASSFAFSAGANETTSTETATPKFNFTRGWDRPHASQANSGRTAAKPAEASEAKTEVQTSNKPDAIVNDQVAYGQPKKFRLTRGWDRPGASAANQI